jgi:hypothetical protein
VNARQSLRGQQLAVNPDFILLSDASELYKTWLLNVLGILHDVRLAGKQRGPEKNRRQSTFENHTAEGAIALPTGAVVTGRLFSERCAARVSGHWRSL